MQTQAAQQANSIKTSDESEMSAFYNHDLG